MIGILLVSDMFMIREVNAKNVKTAQQVVEDMGVGWCLGNTLECTDGKHRTTQTLTGITAEEYYETLWNNPLTTKQMIHCIKQKGFGAIRIPVSYTDHMDADGTIDRAWLDRVQEVAEYVLKEDMYCIINIHWENWLVAENDAGMMEKYAYVWRQIALQFRNTGDKLLFSSMNEVRDKKNHYDSVSKGSLEVINALNQIFVNNVRMVGGANSSRYLIVVPYTAYTIPKILEAFALPQDTVENHLIVEVHSYADINGLDWVFQCIDKYLTSQGIPVILGEFGMRAEKADTATRVAYVQNVLNRCKALGIAPFWWDTGGNANSASEVKAYAIFNRRQLTWYFT